MVDAWVTKADVPDPDSEDLPVPAGWRVLVRPMEPEEKTSGGIYKPPSAMDEEKFAQTVGKVLAIGPLAWRRNDMLANIFAYDEDTEFWFETDDQVYRPWANVGDYIVYGKYAGLKLECDGVRLLLLNDDEITCTVPKPELISK